MTKCIIKPSFMDDNNLTTPQNRPNTRSRTLSTGKTIPPTAEKRKRSPDLAGNMSKRSTSESEPSNALIMRTLTAMNSRFDDLPTVQHLNRLEDELHNKIESNTKALREELRAEFRAEMQAQNEKTNQMVSEIKSQIRVQNTNESTAPRARSATQQLRYTRARRSFKIWPVTLTEGQHVDDAVRLFFTKYMGVPMDAAVEAEFESVKTAELMKNSKIKDELLVTFVNVECRDAIKTYASGLASSKGEAGLRLDIPPCLKGSFKILNEHGLAMIRIYGKEVKRNIHFDDRNDDFMMDLKLPTSTTWHNISIEQAREAKKARDSIDMQNIRQAALSGGQSGLPKEKARALMLAISPERQSGSNFTSPTGVVHINDASDWRTFEGGRQSRDTSCSSQQSVEEVLRGGSSRRTGSQRTGSNRTQQS